MRKSYATMITIMLMLIVGFAAVPRGQAGGLYDIRSKPFFPLIGWNTREMHAEDIKKQADCGITITVVTHEQELEYSEENRLKVLVRGMDHLMRLEVNQGTPEEIERATVQLREKIGNYKKNPLVLGFCLWDEPRRSNLEAYEHSLKVMKTAAPDLLVYTNLFPNYSQPYQHGFKDYQEYVDSFCELFQKYPAPLLVYDSYANRKTDYGKNDYERQVKFLDNLQTVREISLKRDVPFWNTVLAAAHDYYPDPTEGDLHWEVFTSLAYGSQGITYFTWQAQPAFAYQGGPIDIFGEKTPIWTYLKHCNFQVRMLAPILLKLKSTGVFYSVTSEAAPYFTGFPKLPGRLLQKVSCQLERNNFLIGEFKHTDNSDWCMIVNLDTENVAHFKIEMAQDRAIQSYNNYLGTPCTLDTWLKPGQGKLYRIE